MAIRTLLRLVFVLAACVIVASVIASTTSPQTAATVTPAPAPEPAATRPAEPSPVATHVVPASGGVFIEGLVGRPGEFNPLLSPASQADSDVTSLIFSGLTRRDDNGHITGDLAEQWQVSGDASVITFTLRQGLSWHDGAPVTADDVLYTVQALQGNDFPVVSWLKDLWEGVRAERIDDLTVRLILPQPYAPFLQYTTLGLIPAHLLAGKGPAAREDFADNPVGAGPYAFAERSDDQVVLSAFSRYKGPAPLIPRLEFRYYADQTGAIAALKSGQILALSDVTPEQGEGLATSGIPVYWAPRASQAFVIFNLALPFFDDADVRRALMLAIDRQSIVDSVLEGKARLSEGPFLLSSWATTPLTETLAYDPAQARAILDQAGWRDTNKDGVRERDGVNLEFGLLTNDDPARVQVAERIGRAWTAVGAAVEVQVIDSNDLVQDYLKTRNFEAVLFGLTDLPDDPDPYEMWHSSQTAPAGLNFAGFASQQADEILEQARRTGDMVTRKNLYASFQSIFSADNPALYLYEPMFGYAVSPKVQGVRLGYITEPADRLRSLADWYVLTAVVAEPSK